VHGKNGDACLAMGAVDKIASVREAMAVAMHGNAWGRASGKSGGAEWPAARYK